MKKSLATNNPGFVEFSNFVLAGKLLQELPFVTVLKPQFGYQDGSQSWFVSEWKQLESAGYAPYIWFGGSGFNDYGERVGGPHYFSLRGLLDHELSSQEYEAALQQEREMTQQARQIHAALHSPGLEFYDLDDNLFYNWDTRHFVLLDPSVIPSDVLGQESSSPGSG